MTVPQASGDARALLRIAVEVTTVRASAPDATSARWAAAWPTKTVAPS